MYRYFFKRFFDIILSFFALIILSPVFLTVAILVRIKLGTPIIFKQKRPGRGDKIFSIYKFRSMTDARGEDGELLPDDVRLTKFGKRLRSLSLDELPQIWNILKGDMSIIGPRPFIVNDVVFFNDLQRNRARIRPGLTGLAQVNGRNSISWDATLKYDLEYVDKISFLLDLKIFFRTIKIVIKREGINAEGMATNERFGDYLLRTGRINETKYEEELAVANDMLRKAV